MSYAFPRLCHTLINFSEYSHRIPVLPHLLPLLLLPVRDVASGPALSCHLRVHKPPSTIWALRGLVEPPTPWCGCLRVTPGHLLIFSGVFYTTTSLGENTKLVRLWLSVHMRTVHYGNRFQSIKIQKHIRLHLYIHEENTTFEDTQSQLQYSHEFLIHHKITLPTTGMCTAACLLYTEMYGPNVAVCSWNYLKTQNQTRCHVNGASAASNFLSAE